MAKGDREYLHSLTSGLWLPAMQALLTGLLVALVVTVLGLIFRWRGPFQIGGVIGLIAFALAWLFTWQHWQRLTIGNGESIGLLASQNRTLFRNSETAYIQPERYQEIRVIVNELSGEGHLSSGQYLDFPCNSSQLLELSRGLLEQDLSFSERNFCGAAKPFSVIGFRQLRQVFQDRGLIAPASCKSPQQGFVLTLAGKHILTGILKELQGK